MRIFARTAAIALTLVVGCASPLPPIATEREFTRWAAADEARGASFARFEEMLRREGVGDVLPAYDLWIVDRLEARCVQAPFVAPPEEQWPNIVATLRFIRDHVEPAIGEVRAVSAFRDEAFNTCIGGAPGSAHRQFIAVDLVPADPLVTRARLIEILCAVHTREGPAFDVGLGIYSRRRFHIDTRGYRGWGANHRATSFPCSAEPPSRREAP